MPNTFRKDLIGIPPPEKTDEIIVFEDVTKG